MFLRICGSFKSAKNNWARKSQICKSQKVYGPQIANPQIATFQEGPQIQKNQVQNLADLQFAELICGPPTFCKYKIKANTNKTRHVCKLTSD